MSTCKNQGSFQTKLLTLLGLIAIILLAAFLRFYNLGVAGVGNEYYAAAVKSMLASWHNFFFVAYEPGASISVDKPPLGLWFETASAAIFGLNGFALAFPNAICGVLSISLLYSMVRKQFGTLAGLSAALTLAVTPVTIAAERNNTMDGMLVFALLLAAWATLISVETGKFRYFFFGIFIVGLGFNIKMLQAYMTLPALYALYFFGAKHAWGKRVVHLCAATFFLLIVSFSWALIVDAVPASSRPFIGSSTDNTVTELIIGHNGINRLMSDSSLENNLLITGNSKSNLSREVGDPGITRLFTEPLAPQASWLLPLALVGSALALLKLGNPFPLTDKHLALILWAGWLLPSVFYFTFTSGLWHAYYLIMLGPALAALIGSTVWALGSDPNWRLIAPISGLTLGFEIFTLSVDRSYFPVTSIIMTMLWLTGIVWMRLRPQAWALGLILVSLLIAPLLWSCLTTFNPQPDVDLPRAGSGIGQISGSTLNSNQQKILDYLLAKTEPGSYLFATMDSHGASAFILATGLPVFTFGGYIGNDNVIDVFGLQELIANGKLRFILDNNNLSQKLEIAKWVEINCRVVEVPGVVSTIRHNSGGPRDQQFRALYDCGE